MKFFDWHCDTLSRIANSDRCFVTKDSLDVFESAIQTFAIYTPDALSEDEGYMRAKRQLAAFDTNAFDTSILSIENCKMLKDGAKTLEKFHEAGVFLFSLTHNAENRFACGCAADGGVKPAGRDLLSAAFEMNMTLDVSHLSRKAFFEAVDLFGGPVIASHSCFAGVCPHRRNLTDDMACVLFDRGGLVGINVYPEFLGGASLDDIVEHIEHAFLIGGGKHIAFGCDMDGISKLPNGIEKYGDIAKIATLLAKRGFSDGQISDIFYNNSYNFLKENGYLGFLQYQKLKA